MTYFEFPKIDALRKKCNAEEWYWFARDVTESGHKAFCAIRQDALEERKEMFDTNQHLYEVLPADQPIRPYFDLEIETDNYDGLLEKFIDWLNIIWQTEFGLKPEYIILDSCRDNKLSYHLIIKNCYFESVQELKPFILWLFETMLKSPIPELLWKYGDEQRVIFDKIPYGNGQNFRMINQSKRGKTHILKGDYNPIDTLVRKVSGILLTTHKYKVKKSKKTEPETEIESSIFDDKQVAYKEEFEEYLKFNLLNKIALSGTWEEWRNMGFALYNTFQQNGLSLFITFSKINQQKYDEKNTLSLYNSLKNCSKKITFQTIRMWAKKTDAVLFKRIYSIYIDRIEERHYCDNDDEASDIIIGLLEDKLIYVNRPYYKQDNIWVCDSEKIKAILTNYIMAAPIYKTDAKGNVSAFWANYSSADKVFKTIMNKIVEFQLSADKFHTTTKHRLCFMNGVLDMKKKKFYLWEDVDFEYYSVVQIPYDYEKTESKDIMSVLEPLFGDKIELALRYLARALAGCVEDKNFATYLGNRDCGKGGIASLLCAFGDYVKPFLLANVSCQRERVKEDAKEMYWLMDFEYVRIALSQEVPVETKLRGELMKKIHSGGDTHTGKRNYDRTDTLFQVDCSMLMMGNEKINVTGDLAEHHIAFDGAIQFKSQSFIDEMATTLPPEAMMKYRVADPNIKEKCMSKSWHLQMVQLILDSYTDEPIVMAFQEEREESIIEKFLKDYEWTKDKKDVVLGSEVDYLGSKIKAELKQLGIEYKKIQTKSHPLYSKWVFVGIKKVLK